MSEAKWYLRTADSTLGPVIREILIEWAKVGGIQAGQEVSCDNAKWHKVEDVPFLDMRFSIAVDDGRIIGPMTRSAAEQMLSGGGFPADAKVIEVREPFAKEDEIGAQDEDRLAERVSIVEKGIVKEVRVEVPVEKVVEKIVVDETRVKELENALNEVRADLEDSGTTIIGLKDSLKEARGELESTKDERDSLHGELESTKNELDSLRGELDAARASIAQLEENLAKLPMTIDEASKKEAFVQAMLKTEAEEMGRRMELERAEFEDQKKSYVDRINRMLGRRREMLKRSGADPSMIPETFAAETSEAPQIAKLKKELEDVRRAYESEKRDSALRLAALNEQLGKNEQPGKGGQQSPDEAALPKRPEPQPIPHPPPISLPDLGNGRRFEPLESGGHGLKLPRWMQLGK